MIKLNIPLNLQKELIEAKAIVNGLLIACNGP